MKSHTRRTILTLVPLAIVATLLTGCPRQPGTLDIWVLNTSNNVVVTNVKITNDSDSGVVEEFSQDLAVNTGRVIGNVDAGPFEGSTATIEINGTTGGEILDEVDATVNVPHEIAAGDVLVLVVRGGSILDYDAELVPLESASKGMLLMRQQAGSLPIGG